jgi:hypothetical protein
MSGAARSTRALCSRPSTPLRAPDRGGLRPALTAAVRGALRRSGRDGETPFSRTYVDGPMASTFALNDMVGCSHMSGLQHEVLVRWP